ncbi:MAG: lutA 1 [Firmicutes bacterium]|nr:lutA 1 [Bacillota bacterium]
MKADAVRRVVNQCVRCGQCRSVCPVFQEIRTEAGVARGKLALLRSFLEGKDVPEAELQGVLNKCLLCKTCGSQCPSGVAADELVLAGRELLAEKNGLSPIKKAIFTVLKNRSAFDFCLSMASLGQRFGVKRLKGKHLGAIARFPMPGLARRRIIPMFADKPLRKQYPEVIKVKQPKARVAFFTGCMANYIYTGAGQATIDVLLANQIEVVLPKMQHCCGYPVFTSGDAEGGRLLARHNIDVFSELQVDAVITVCGSCGSAWRHEYQRLLTDDAQYLKKLEGISCKTYDIAEYLTEVMPLDKTALGEVKAQITIHDPCHLGERGMGVTKQVRQLVSAIPGITITEMKQPGRCCGSGGSFNMAHYDLSREINDCKIADIAKTGAGLVITGCSSCRMHLTDGLVQNRKDQIVMHTVELLAQAYAAKQGREKHQHISS